MTLFQNEVANFSQLGKWRSTLGVNEPLTGSLGIVVVRLKVAMTTR